MTDADLLALADRVEKLTGPDRGVDGLVAELIYGWKPARVGPDYDGNHAGDVLTPNGKLYDGFSYPPRGKIHRAYHCDLYTRDCLDPAFPKNAVRKKLAEDIRARASTDKGEA